ncbi:MAG: NAD+ synthase [Phycisphaerales bacterium]
MRIALAPLNPIVGDLDGNAALIARAADEARAAGADLLVTPEQVVCGYPARDLIYRREFVEACARAAKQVGEAASHGLTLVIGTPLPVDKSDPGAGVANSLVVYRDGQFVDYYDKRLLPTYDVFDEDRYFTPGDRAAVIEVAGERVGLSICEDLWKGEDVGFRWRYRNRADPVTALVEAGARVIVNPSGSPFVLGKGRRHAELLSRHAREHGVYVASLNQLGGNDDLVFDGQAAVYAPGGDLIATNDAFGGEMLVVDTTNGREATGDPLIELADEELVWRALVLGVRDYLRKTGFKTALVALSGGVDSALTAVVAAAAIGAENLTGASLPGKYSSEHSREDAVELARRLSMNCVTIPIGAGESALRQMLDPAFSQLGQRLLGHELPDVAEENLQSRLRGVTMMALSNRTGALLLTTGNKSELAVGYCTLYGDMNGGLAVLSDVPKTMVYRVARWVNEQHARLGFETAPIPERTISKPPSAELAPNQLDSDSLPSYDVLDEIIERYVERREPVDRLLAQTGFERGVVEKVLRLIRVNEYKRRQLAVGIKVTSVAFGAGRRMPIAQGWD